MKDWHESAAEKIPAVLRKNILQEGWIDTVVNVHENGTPMDFLFEIYEEYVDTTGENDDFGCGKCRQKVIDGWRKMKDYLIKLENGKESN